ncbi:MAG: SUKH-4 family immunity protein [Candidatus Accumulibacter sp.]|nr:SUKH-4 family immunity protein [Accumulibacter sp.]
MVTPHDFKAFWEANGGELTAFPESTFVGVNISQEAKTFLRNAGMPSSAAPFLTFNAPKTGSLPTVAEAWGVGDKFSRHYIIGFNGSGDPIAISPMGPVVCLNHDFGFAEVYINQDISVLAETLLQCSQLIKRTLEIAGPGAYLNGLVPTNLKTEFIEFLQETDPLALHNDAMWAVEISMWVA